MSKEKYEKIKKISIELDLNFETQDWGIINADCKRVIEFVNYFEKINEDEVYVRYDLFELIVASYNEALLINLVDEKLEDSFINFLYQNIHKTYFKPIIDYWIKIQSEEYPVGYILEKLG